jgi:hypothetical protein
MDAAGYTTFGPAGVWQGIHALRGEHQGAGSRTYRAVWVVLPQLTAYLPFTGLATRSVGSME